ncbi:MAG TPA: oxygen-insensitive NAD(P)H nitroreductase [Rhodocyclaceae bacterium]|nr:oxygen-insensitive NAD(P)H nitroreductase [Rhodocyclaceae bacterium]HMY49576.1 oxygen-insensitive NAD(P)H nitroreductase [Rhodocyclaceae bacterium]HNF62211.1 oxygen-insensitive NAD(P)H nitroreductase [Rhodocyclaceae bacterium]HNI82399.1 oxygen-insensitive NAD(P)H nitroreductase [Rhodocyclaceae bacterium]HNO88464.1 oxygen-insensitive NAD(P)H nitroreductase [Rhodocyclaceae bacterium]
MSLTRNVYTRYTTKAFDPARRIPPEVFAELETLLRFAPSSVNSQPWHFFIADDDAGKARIARATPAAYAYNEGKIRNASHVVVLAVRKDLDDAHLAALLEQEDRDGRFPTREARANQEKARAFYVGLHRNELKDVQTWASKQVYLALGALLLGAATLELDAAPLEGFDTQILDAELGLAERGLTSLVIVALGYHSSDDFNARLPKSRLPAERVITRL